MNGQHCESSSNLLLIELLNFGISYLLIEVFLNCKKNLILDILDSKISNKTMLYRIDLT